MMKFAFAAGLAVVASSAQAVTIDFESYSSPTNFVSFTDSGATFTGLGATTGFEISDYDNPDWDTAAPQILCPRTAANYCGGDFEVTFANTIVGLTFLFTGDDSVQPLTVEAFLGASSLGSVVVFGDGSVSITSHLVDLTSFGSLDKIVVTGAGLDPAGYAYDDFTFELAGSGAVPEPASWAMMIAGLGLTGGVLRRQRRVAALA